MSTAHVIENIMFTENEMVITADGATHRFSLPDVSRKLSKATMLERERYEISPSGYGIHWPLLDEDLSIDGLLGIRHYPPFSYQKAA